MLDFMHYLVCDKCETYYEIGFSWQFRIIGG